MHTMFSKRLLRWIAWLCVLSMLLTGCAGAPAATTAPGVTTAPTARPTLAPAATTTPAATIMPTGDPAQTPATGAYWPTEGWRTSTPEAQGMDSQKLAQMLAAVEEQKLALHSLLIVRNGYLVSETYFGSYQQDTLHIQYSCTKSFVATLIGIAMDKGYIDRTDRNVLDFFPESTFENPDDRKKAMTLDDLLTMRSGLDWEEGDPAYRAMYQSSNWVKFVLDLPMASQPGSEFNYCSGCSHVLSAILQQTTGMSSRDFAEKTLFEPLGISKVRWEADAKGISIGGWGLQITPRDMAKLGYLYLHNGQWDGQQIVSAEWVRNATQQHTGTGGDVLGYGYQWWTYPSLAAYTALGRDGQTIFVIPDADLIVVTTAAIGGHDEIFQLIEQYVVPAVNAVHE
ncbi:MAG: serine hydrolase [Anaerolineae bacterium]|nr:serine hydrolase [Anaerolineae bacterium]